MTQLSTTCQLLVLSACNALHILFGLTSVALASCQFALPELTLPTLYIDFRMLNGFHVLVGAVGIFLVLKSYGCLAAQVLYCIDCALSLWTIVFYIATSYDVNLEYQRERQIQALSNSNVNGNRSVFYQEFEMSASDQRKRLLISVAMATIGFIELLNGVVCCLLIRRLANDEPMQLKSSTMFLLKSASADQWPSATVLHRRDLLLFVTLLKLLLVIVALCLGSYFEYANTSIDRYIKIGLDKLSLSIALSSSIVDLFALYSRKNSFLNLKTSLILSVVSFVLMLKAFDYLLTGYFVKSLQSYYLHSENGIESTAPPHFITASNVNHSEKFFVLSALLIFVLLLYLLFLFSALLVADSLEIECSNRSLICKVDKATQNIRNLFGTLQLVWGIGILCLICASFAQKQPFTRGYSFEGAILPALLFIATGAATASRVKTFSTATFALSLLSTLVATESLMLTLGMIYQSVSSERLRSQWQSNRGSNDGRVVMYALQSAFLAMQILTSMLAAIYYSTIVKSIPLHPPPLPQHCNLKRCFYSLNVVHLLYAVAAVVLNIGGQALRWSYGVPADYLPLILQMTSGAAVFALAIAQFLAASQPKFLLPHAMLAVACATTTFFVIAPCSTFLQSRHYLAYQLHLTDISTANNNLFEDSSVANETRARLNQLHLVVSLAWSLLVLAALELVASIVSAMLSSHFLHHSSASFTNAADRHFTTKQRLSKNNISGIAARHNGVVGVDLKPYRFGDVDFKPGNHDNQLWQPWFTNFNNDSRSSSSNFSHVNHYAQTNIRHVFHNGTSTTYLSNK